MKMPPTGGIFICDKNYCLVNGPSANETKQQRNHCKYKQNMDQAAADVSYKKAEDPANYQDDCDQIKDTSHDVMNFGEYPISCKDYATRLILRVYFND